MIFTYECNRGAKVCLRTDYDSVVIHPHQVDSSCADCPDCPRMGFVDVSDECRRTFPEILSYRDYGCVFTLIGIGCELL